MAKVKNKDLILSPVLKWVGGKRQLLGEIIPLIPKEIKYYVEPFVGGGAVVFDLKPNRAIINDSNKELINVYKTIRDNPEELLLLLEEHQNNNNEDYYYYMRALDRDEEFERLSNIQRAARIIYLNKTCFNGLFRVNKAGQFNTPYGKYKNPNIVNEPVVRAMANYFNNNEILIEQGDYKKVLRNLEKDSFVYLDPPYLPISSSSSFTGYTEGGFGLESQIELRDQCNLLNGKGISFILSNSAHPIIKDLYKDYRIDIVRARRAINSKGNKRGEINEVLVRNYG